MKILRDTREQRPLLFKTFDDIEVVKDTLTAGDYTLVGHDLPSDDNSVIIERKKDCQELIGNIGTHWDRFKAEAEILSKYKYKMILVCGHNNFDYLVKQKYTQLNLNFIYSRLGTLLVEYNLPVVFIGDAATAETYIHRLFISILRKTKDEN